MMDEARRIELLETLIATMIHDLGYPVGCGLAPHPEAIRKMAENCYKVATVEPAPEQTR